MGKELSRIFFNIKESVRIAENTDTPDDLMLAVDAIEFDVESLKNYLKQNIRDGESLPKN